MWIFITIITVLLLAGLAVGMYYLFRKKKNSDNPDNSNNSNKSIPKPPHHKYKGVVLFDVDGTLRGKDLSVNYDTVQTCIDQNFAVGIATANGRYTPTTAHTFLNDWLPKNLYDFMKKTNWITFNSILGNILAGKKIPSYSDILDIKQNAGNPTELTYYGYCKGYALNNAAKLLGINKTSCMIICDDDSEFIEGILKYNPKFNVVCAGQICGGDLNKDIMNKALFNAVEKF